VQQQWERRFPHAELTLERATTLLRPAIAGARAVALEPLVGGLRNSIFKATLADGTTVVLRLYTADPTACAREAALLQLVGCDVPVSRVLYADASADPPYAVVGWCDGLRFTDLIAAGDEAAIGQAAASAGTVLAAIQRFTFPHSGELGPDLAVSAPQPMRGRDIAEHLIAKTNSPLVIAQLGGSLVEQLRALLRERADALEDGAASPVLCHADYKPENLLVRREAGVWRIDAVLDWEFALACTRLIDPGLFLRRAHLLPAGYGNAFAYAYAAATDGLPADWRERARIIDLVNLLDFLDIPDERPALFRDVTALVAAIVAIAGR
jgi:aminoglycoside phosphotransferase (APT) family kinase protein